MTFSHRVLVVMLTLSLAGTVMVSCRRIHPPTPTSKPAASQPANPQAATASAPVPKFIWYTIRPGDDAGKIARRQLVGGQADDIVKNNPQITAWTKLQPGMKVRLPIRKLRDKTILDSPTVQFADDPPPRPARPDEELPHPYP